MNHAVQVEVGDQVFAGKNPEPFGAVRFVHAHELVIGIEGAGDVTVPATSVQSVQEHKVVLDVGTLPFETQSAIKHAHEKEHGY